MTWHNAPVKTLAEAISEESTLGASTTSSDSHVLAVLSNNLLGTKFKIVHGYDGSTAVDLAVERGEVDGEAGKDWTTILSARPQWITEKKINILVQMGMKPHPDLVGVPMAIDLAKTPEDRRIMEMIFAKYGMARPILVAPGVPTERLEALRRAFGDTMKIGVPGRSPEAQHGDKPGEWPGRRGSCNQDNDNSRRSCGASPSGVDGALTTAINHRYNRGH